MNVFRNKNKSADSLTSSKNKRLQQIKTVSDEKLIKDLFIPERIVWTAISSLTEYKNLYKEHLQKILQFYGMLKNTLKIFVSIKSKEEKSLQITEDESNHFLKSFGEIILSLENIFDCQNNQGRYLQSSTVNAISEVRHFFAPPA